LWVALICSRKSAQALIHSRKYATDLFHNSRTRLRAGCDAVEGDVVAFEVPPSYEGAGGRRLGVVTAEMSCTAWVHPLVEQGAEQGQEQITLVEDEAYEEPMQVQEGILAVLDDVYYGQLPVPSLGGGIGYGATAVECWTLERSKIPDGVDVPVSESGVAPWTH